MKRAAIYCRVSTEEQAKHGLSIQAQYDSLMEYARANDYVVADRNVYIDDGISGQKGYKKRPEMSRLMTELDSVDVILFIRLDRWFRSVKLYYEAQELLDRADVAWIATQEDYETVTSTGRFKVNIMLSVAQNEAEKASERVRFVFESKLEKGEALGGVVAVGFRREGKHIVVDEESAGFVRNVFNKYVEMRSCCGVSKWLISQGVDMTQNGVRYMLKNRKYCGTIIDEDTFLTVQDILAVRAQRNITSSHVYLFSGLVRCAECGRRMRATITMPKDGKPRVYYQCSRYRLQHRCTHKRMTSETALEKWLETNAVACLAETTMNLRREQSQKVKLDVSPIKRKIERLRDLYVNEMIELDDYRTEYGKLKKQLDEMEMQNLKTDTRPEVPMQEFCNALEALKALPPNRKKEFWSKAAKSIIIDKDNNITVEWRFIAE